ncbi:Uncharacterized protein Adt_40114 [Abeliophyllum distichum]|uniref:Transposase MuDR plant domain-containing protein n=1 Tax=Abeliophyllum distichum TaxID=126358 RepID=A0ABD1Q709_9LAMI
MQLKWLIELNEKNHTPLCVTLVRRDQPVNRHDAKDEAGDEMYRNGDNFWNTIEIAGDDDVVFPEMNATQRSHEIVQDNEEEFRFTNDDLIASVSRGHQAGPSSQSFRTTQVIPNVEDLHVDRLFDKKKDLQEVVHLIVLKHNFEFKVKKSNKTLYTLACVDGSCKWRLRATKFDTSDIFVI